MYRQKAGPIWVVLSLLLAMSVPAGAQDAVPETPPELRDFRLDPPQPSPGPPDESATLPTPTVTPPPVVRTPPEVEAQSRPTTDRVPTRREPIQAPASASSSPTTGPEPEAEPVEPVGAEPVIGPTAPEAATDPETIPASQSTQGAWDNMTLILGLFGGAAALGLAGWLLFRRRRSSVYAAETESVAAASDVEPFEPVTTKPKPQPSFPPVSPPTTHKPATPPPQPASDVNILFVPEKATISFTTLTVQGQLQIANEGKAPAKNMELRAVLLSASARQQGAIASFFADPSQIAPNALGEAKPGERLSLSLELSVSLSEMQSFPIGDRRLLVPILVANLSYSGADGRKEEARLACMIGREAQPPKPKMGPLRLDQGPRSFTPLGQRPVYA